MTMSKLRPASAAKPQPSTVPAAANCRASASAFAAVRLATTCGAAGAEKQDVAAGDRGLQVAGEVADETGAVGVVAGDAVPGEA